MFKTTVVVHFQPRSRTSFACNNHWSAQLWTSPLCMLQLVLERMASSLEMNSLTQVIYKRSLAFIYLNFKNLELLSLVISENGQFQITNDQSSSLVNNQLCIRGGSSPRVMMAASAVANSSRRAITAVSDAKSLASRA